MVLLVVYFLLPVHDVGALRDATGSHDTISWLAPVIKGEEANWRCMSLRVYSAGKVPFRGGVDTKDTSLPTAQIPL